MGWQVIEQPDGKLCIFTTERDEIFCWDADDAEVVTAIVQENLERAISQAMRTVRLVRAGKAKHVYFQHAMSYAKAVETHLRLGGDPSVVVNETPDTAADPNPD